MPTPTRSGQPRSANQQVQGRSAAGRYTYRAGSHARTSSNANAEHAKLAHALGVHRQILSHAASSIRTLTSARNELIAQAVEDGISIATIAAAIGENARSVRTIALAYDDLHLSGLPRRVQLEALKAKNDALREAERHRDVIMERREALIAIALRTQACDELELASLTGLTPDHIRRSGRSVGRTA